LYDWRACIGTALYSGILAALQHSEFKIRDQILLWYGVWPIKCCQGSKTNKSNCRFWKKSIYDWLVENRSQDLFGQRPQDCNERPHQSKGEYPESQSCTTSHKPHISMTALPPQLMRKRFLIPRTFNSLVRIMQLSTHQKFSSPATSWSPSHLWLLRTCPHPTNNPDSRLTSSVRVMIGQSYPCHLVSPLSSSEETLLFPCPAISRIQFIRSPQPLTFLID
jgi:hypothetical protein